MCVYIYIYVHAFVSALCSSVDTWAPRRSPRDPPSWGPRPAACVSYVGCLFVCSFVRLFVVFVCLSCWFGYLFVCSCCCSVKHNYVCRLCLLYVIVYYYGACVSSMYLMYLYVYSRTTTLTRVGHRSPAKRICRTSDVVTPDRPGDRTITAIVVAINNSSYW